MKADKSMRKLMITLGLTLLFLLFLFSSNLVRFYTDYLWFQSLDYTEIFNTRVFTNLGVVIVSFLVTSVVLLVNWSLIPYSLFPQRELRATIRGRHVSISTRPLRLVFTATSVAIGLFFGLAMSGQWLAYLMARHGIPFELTDPIFGKDAAFYLFKLPWYETLLFGGKVLVALTFVGLVLRYGTFGQIQERGAIAHLSLIGAIWLILLSISRLLNRFALLQSNLGVVFGAGYTDTHARMVIYVGEAILFALAACVLIINSFTRKWKLLLMVGAAWILVSLIGVFYPPLIQQYRVEPNEFMLERPYIKHNIDFTRYAYGLDQIQEQDYAATGAITPSALETETDILSNVRLWDYRPLRRTYEQLQEIRLYYTFNEIDIDRYIVNGEPREVMLAVRELDVNELADQAQTWFNRHLIFTHGYGLALSPASEVSPEGLPRLLIRDIPPISDAPELTITQPAIYFGESTHQYVIVNTSEKEFDYPKGDINQYTRYTGPAGVPLRNIFRRILLASRFNSSQILLSSALSAESRILFHRTIKDRTQTIAPMLWYDDDPYPVIANGGLVWLLDAYTWTDHFPYSEPINSSSRGMAVNYIRNSVKVTIDAYTGEVTFYLIDPNDPIAATYARIFPDLFKPSDAMPQVLREHWRYPETLFLYQSQLYGTYHMRDPQVFYNREDLWDIPQELVETEQVLMEPYYVLTRLPDSEQLEFMLIRPYVPKQKQNMIAWLYGDSDGEDYGELGVFKLSKERLIYGPLQIEARTDQDPIISQQLSLWNQRGSRVLRGNLLVVPLQNTFIYIEPLYLEAESGQLPELTRVIVAYDERVAMAPTLDEALVQVLIGREGNGETQPFVTPERDMDLDTLAQQAWEHYQAAQACLQQGDWSCYGREQDALEQILRAMAEGEREPPEQ